MPYKTLDLHELAMMLGSDYHRVERRAQRGEIPSQKVKGQFRFNRAEISQWLQHTLGTMPSEDLSGIDTGMVAVRQIHQQDAVIAPLLHVEAVSAELDARTKSSAIRKLVALAENTGFVYDGDTLLSAVMEREASGCTALPNGLAMPHPASPLPYALAEPVMAVACLPRPLVFGPPPHGSAVRLLFLCASQDHTHHVHVMARLCRMLHDPDFLQQLIEAGSAQQIITLLTQREQHVMTRS